jgi:glycosyltransferase involved in cell wall biosynthesis
MMRVAYVCADPGVPVFGTKGCSTHIQEVLRVLVSKGAEVSLFPLRTGGDCPGDLSAIHTHAMPQPISGSGPVRERELLAVNGILRKMLAEHGPFDLIYERHSLWAYAAMEFARQSSTPGILEVNAPLIDEQLAHRRLHSLPSARWSAERAFHAAEHIVVVSAAVADYVAGFGVSRSRVEVVPNGVRVERFEPRPQPQVRDSNSFTIGFLGTLRPWHGVSDLISAFGRMHTKKPLASHSLRIVGDGPQRQALQQQVATFPAEIRTAIEFVGTVAYEQVPRELAKMDAAVAPYASDQDCYFSPIKLFEYMAAGVPVVAARTGQLTEIISHGENGLLYSPGDVDALAAALCELHDDVAQRDRLAQAARRDVEQRHTWRQRVDQILSLIAVPQRRSGTEQLQPTTAR